MFAALFAGTIATGAMLMPFETSARPGGMAGGGPAGGMRPMMVRPPIAPQTARPAMQAPTARTAHPRTQFGRFLPRHHHRFAGVPVGGWWPAGPYYDTTSAAAPYPEPAYPVESAPSQGYPIQPNAAPYQSPVVQHVTRVIVVGSGCDSQFETIPWRDGSERTIRMVRC
jgi:hypothetical protein